MVNQTLSVVMSSVVIIVIGAVVLGGAIPKVEGAFGTADKASPDEDEFDSPWSGGTGTGPSTGGGSGPSTGGGSGSGSGGGSPASSGDYAVQLKITPQDTKELKIGLEAEGPDEDAYSYIIHKKKGEEWKELVEEECRGGCTLDSEKLNFEDRVAILGTITTKDNLLENGNIDKSELEAYCLTGFYIKNSNLKQKNLAC